MKAGVREDHRTGQYVPTVNGVDVSPTSFDERRALEIARQAAGEVATKAWYLAKTGNHQGLIIDEQTGANIAVAYDKADGPLIAAAPELLEALKELVDAVWDGRLESEGAEAFTDPARAAIAKATEGAQ